jgi:hypothetical protein
VKCPVKNIYDSMDWPVRDIVRESFPHARY